MVKRADVEVAYETALKGLEQSASLLRNARKTQEFMNQGTGFDRQVKNAASFASGLNTTIIAFATTVTEPVLRFAQKELQQNSTRLQKSIDVSKSVNVELQSLVTAKANSNSQTGKSFGELIRTYFAEISEALLTATDFDSDLLIDELAKEKAAVLAQTEKNESPEN